MGLAAAREGALRGLATAVVEKSDLAGATSANSLKLIHGGLRYLPTRRPAETPPVGARAPGHDAPRAAPGLPSALPHPHLRPPGQGVRGHASGLPALRAAGRRPQPAPRPPRKAHPARIDPLPGGMPGFVPGIPQRGAHRRGGVPRRAGLEHRAAGPGLRPGGRPGGGRGGLLDPGDRLPRHPGTGHRLPRQRRAGRRGVRHPRPPGAQRRRPLGRRSAGAAVPTGAHQRLPPGQGGEHRGAAPAVPDPRRGPRGSPAEASDSLRQARRAAFFITPWRGCSIIGTTYHTWRHDPDTLDTTVADIRELIDGVNAAWPQAALQLPGSRLLALRHRPHHPRDGAGGRAPGQERPHHRPPPGRGGRPADPHRSQVHNRPGPRRAHRSPGRLPATGKPFLDAPSTTQPLPGGEMESFGGFLAQALRRHGPALGEDTVETAGPRPRHRPRGAAGPGSDRPRPAVPPARQPGAGSRGGACRCARRWP